MKIMIENWVENIGSLRSTALVHSAADIDERRIVRRVQTNPMPWGSARGLLTKDHVILNHRQVMWTTPELAPLSPNYHTTPTGERFSSRQI
ncbi:hypothetical protein TNCV_1314531 [Trichonephila clavipes]|nr:hypothetical protein TNCV_1314531 [Trichonephila clavipes]